jgi:hypothetical protein
MSPTLLTQHYLSFLVFVLGGDYGFTVLQLLVTYQVSFHPNSIILGNFSSQVVDKGR